MRKNGWQRALSFLTAITMSLTVMAGTGLTAFAEKSEPTEQTQQTVTEAVKADEAEQTKSVPEDKAQPDEKTEDKQTEATAQKTESSTKDTAATTAQKADENAEGAVETTKDTAKQVNTTAVTDEKNAPVLGAVIDSVDVTVDPDLFLVNGVYKDSTHLDTSKFTVPSGMSIEEIHWQEPGGTELTDGESFVDINEYRLLMKLKGTGVEFTNSTEITVNGEPAVNLNGTDGIAKDTLQFELSFFPTVKEYITSIHLINVPEPQVGQSASLYSYAHEVGGNTQYTAQGKRYVWNPDILAYEETGSDTFENGKAYRSEITIKAEPGYAFVEGVDITVNGEPAYGDDAYIITLAKNFQFGMEEITSIEIDESKIPAPVAGQDFENEQFDIECADERVILKGMWRDDYGNLQGTFENGEVYWLDITCYAKDGYIFSDYLDVKYGSSMHATYAGGVIFEESIRKSLKTRIDAAEIYNAPTAKIGDTLKSGDVELATPTDAKYTAIYYWMKNNNPIENDTTVKEGEVYKLWIVLRAKDGYEFAEKTIVTIDGIKHLLDGGDEDVSYMRKYSFLNQIQHIEVTDVKEPVIGEKPVTTGLKTPDGAPYEITAVEWYDYKTNELATEFENGHAYYLGVRLTAHEGYEFAAYATYSIGNETDGNIGGLDQEIWIYTNEYSFENLIKRVDIDKLQEVKVGEVPASSAKVPEGAKYFTNIYWSVWDEKTQYFEEFNGVFESGKAYSSTMRIDAEDGYRFDKNDTDIYVNGVKVSDEEKKNFSITNNAIHYDKSFNTGNEKKIDKVEINITAPKIGDHSSIKPEVTLPQGVNYSLGSDVYWNIRYGEGVGNVEGYFKEGVDYGVSLRLIADSGYVFSEDLVVVVNGIAVDTVKNQYKNVNIDYFFDMTCKHVYDNDEDMTCNVCGESRGNAGADGGAGENASTNAGTNADTSPKTGDSLPVAVALVMLVSGGLAVATAVYKKKQRQ